MNAAVAERRLANQRLSNNSLRHPGDVVAWFGAVQAQEYATARWAIGLRMRDGTRVDDIERAFDAGRILRTHVMRPTWHFVTPADIRWLLELTAPRVRAAMASYQRKLGLDDRLLARALAVIEPALGDRCYLTRRELSLRLERAGLAMTSQRLAQVMLHAELEAVICSGPRRDQQFTYALVAERAPKAGRLARDEALATLAERFVRSHGPATIRDFVWWSGLTTADARRAVAMIDARREDVGGTAYWTAHRSVAGTAFNRSAYLLPIYDEYLVAYRDRDAVPHGPSLVPAASGSVTFRHAIVIAGQVAGTWRLTKDARGTRLEQCLFQRLTRAERRALDDAVERYQRFVNPLSL
jgi:hypothetical protein